MLNIDSLLPADNKTDTQDSNIDFPLTINKLLLSNGQLTWRDERLDKDNSETLDPINITVSDFTLADQSNTKLRLDAATSSGIKLAWIGSLSLLPLKSTGHLDLNGLPLHHAMLKALHEQPLQAELDLALDYQLQYADQQLKLNMSNTVLSARHLQYVSPDWLAQLDAMRLTTDLTVDYAPNHWQISTKKTTVHNQTLNLALNKLQLAANELDLTSELQLSPAKSGLNAVIKADITGKQLQLNDKQTELISLPDLSINGIALNLNNHTVNAKRLTLEGSTIKAWLNENGLLNYQQLLHSDNTAPSGKTEHSSATNWSYQINEINVKQATLQFENKQFTKPHSLILTPINLSLNQFSSDFHNKLPIKLSAGLKSGGLLAVHGDVRLSPLAATIELNLKDLDLAHFQTYYDQFIHLDVIDGLLSINGKLALANDSRFTMHFTGRTDIVDFLTRDQIVHKDFIKWQQLSLSELSLAYPEQRYTANALTINQPYIRATIRKDKTTNFSGLLLPQTKPPATTEVKTPNPTTPVQFNLTKLAIVDGSSDFTDLSLILPFSAHVQGLNGGAQGISSEQKAVFNIKLAGNAYDLAPVDLTGKISPYIGNYDVKINFKGLPMPLVSPYMVQFAGYKVEKGKMSLALDYKVANKKLTASNNLLIDQFELGEKIDNPDAVSIPIKLAVALLKDSNGRIKFDVPITGSLEDPKFNIGAIITDAVVNALGKIVASPFNALASLLGDDKQFSHVMFKPGSADLSADEQKKLLELSKALTERPELSLEIKGTTYQQQDWPAISDDALYDQLKIRRADELNQKNQIKIRPEYVELTQTDYQRLLTSMYQEKIPALSRKIRRPYPRH
ncbi:DUF748 domain-containing protein [Methylocucumis oryzae]|uniref:DUF748 domain-containing protein n=1 Tax=Methylocucumis oryzae TaxID=1632867 RepID=UPI000696E93B|nr:DUF748 domain-containing protein [Methylocucumis oryzae]